MLQDYIKYYVKRINSNTDTVYKQTVEAYFVQ